jgi:AraC-like DNA-binding protein
MQAVPTHPALEPFVARLWVCATGANAPGTREHVLPTGQMHLVFRLHGPPLRLFRDAADTTGCKLAGPVIGGARARYYCKAADAPTLSVGAQLTPGAALALFGVSAAELAQQHTALADVWGSFAARAFEQLANAPGPRARMAMLQDLLLMRVRTHDQPHPAVVCAMAALRQPGSVEQVVEHSAYSHRGFIALFKQAAGLTPKRYARLMRFQTLLAALRRRPECSLAYLAAHAGYSDQAHMTREFGEFSGVTPAWYRALGPDMANHVVLPGRSTSFKPRA